MKCSIAVLAAATCLSSVQQVSGFTSSSIRRDASPLSSSRIRAELEGVKQASTGSDADTFNTDSQLQSRRSILHQCLATGATLSASQLFPSSASAALGTLPEFADVNAVLQSLTIDVTDKQQYDDTIAFFTSAFDGMKVMRQRNNSGGGIKDAWLGFGPETLSTPPDFQLPVSSFAMYGGHASIHLRYDPFATAPLYKRSFGEFNNEPAPGDSIAYLQLGVPQYRISKMVETGGNVIDGYGWVNAVCPAGLPIRSIVGVRPDPIMFLAVNCQDVAKSEEFYAKLGFVRQEYPYARPNQGQGQFEPPQPKKSVYVAPSPNSMGVLLLQNKKRKKAVVPNPVLRSLNVIYAPQDGENGAAFSPEDLDPKFVDPSSIPVSFIPSDYLENEIKKTELAEPISTFQPESNLQTLN